MKILATESWSRSAWNESSNRTLLLMLTLVVLPPLCHTAAHANSFLSGQIAGTVVDQTGATVGGAWVVLFGAAGVEAGRPTECVPGKSDLEVCEKGVGASARNP